MDNKPTDIVDMLLVQLHDSTISEHLSNYGYRCKTETCERIRVYLSLLIHWNKRISLTSVIDPLQILDFHFGESIFALSAGIVGEGRLADVGSGAGFPGIPLALASAGLDVTLIEPNLKKCSFLREVKRELNLKNICIVRSRVEDLSKTCFDFVCSRALGRIEEILHFARGSLSDSGRVVLWLGEAGAKEVRDHASGWRWSETARIPGSDRRSILSGESLLNRQLDVPRGTM